jgi:hypothetical protein
MLKKLKEFQAFIYLFIYLVVLMGFKLRIVQNGLRILSQKNNLYGPTSHRNSRGPSIKMIRILSSITGSQKIERWKKHKNTWWTHSQSVTESVSPFLFGFLSFLVISTATRRCRKQSWYYNIPHATLPSLFLKNHKTKL